MLVPNGGATFSITQQLVVETVIVKDKSGNPARGLTKDDFIITEDGSRKTIKFFDYEESVAKPPRSIPLSTPSSTRKEDRK